MIRPEACYVDREALVVRTEGIVVASEIGVDLPDTLVRATGVIGIWPLGISSDAQVALIAFKGFCEPVELVITTTDIVV